MQIPLESAVRVPDAIAAARELLPAWVVWSRILLPPLLVGATALGVSALDVALLARRCGPASDLHWTERARRIANVLQASRSLAWCVLAPALLIPALLPSALDPVPGPLVALVSLLALILAAHIGAGWELRWIVGREESARDRRRASLSALLLSWPSLFAALTAMLFVGKHPGPAALLLLLVCTAVILFFGLGHGWRLLHKLGLAVEFDVRGLIGDAGGRRRFLLLEYPTANAFALIVAGAVVVSRRAREVLTDEELAAVLQHELGHMQESKRVRTGRMLPLALMLVLTWTRPLLGWFGPWITLALLGSIWIGVQRINSKSKALESAADAHAHEQTGDPRSFARALEKLHRANLTPAVMSRARTHPHLYDRMQAAGLEPDYPRPAATRSTQPWSLVLMLVVFAETAGVDALTRPKSVARAEPAVLRALALGGWTAEHLRTLASLRQERGDEKAANCFREAARTIAPEAAHTQKGSTR